MNSFLVTIDSVCYSSKPQKAEVGLITRRLQASGPVRATPYQLAKAVANGQTWCGGCYKPSRRSWGEFIGQQIFALDFDNDVEVLGADGKPLRDSEGHVVKRDLHPGEEGFLSHWEALDRWRTTFEGDPMLMYPSFSFEQVEDLSRPPTKMKFRLVFDADEAVATEARASDILRKLLRVFPEGDPKCTNSNRLFFGARGKVALFTERGTFRVERD